MVAVYKRTGTSSNNTFTSLFPWDRFQADQDTWVSTKSVDLTKDVTGVVTSQQVNDLTRLCAWVYRDNDSAFADLWSSHGGDYQVIRTSSQLPRRNSPDYYGAIVKHLPTNTFIVVHRGTDNWDSDLNGIDGPPQDPVTGHYYTGWPSRQILDAQQMTNWAYQYADETPNALVYQTGHSLGGRLASIASKNGHADAVFTFNSAWHQSSAYRANVYNFRIADDWVTNIALQENLLEGNTFEVPPLNNSYDTWNRHGMAQFTGQLGFSANFIEHVTLSANSNKALNTIGNSQHNRLTGNQYNNRLSGQDGNDTLLGGAGNDTLDGGRGNDLLRGGSQHDTYLFKKGYGKDIITDDGNTLNSQRDVLNLSDIARKDVRFAYNGVDLTVSYAGGTQTNTVTLTRQNSLNARVEFIQAADGTTVNVNSVIALIASYASSRGVSVGSLNLDNAGLQTYLLSNLHWG
jgi:Ca2+-binding RTX toxin-like protein